MFQNIPSWLGFGLTFIGSIITLTAFILAIKYKTTNDSEKLALMNINFKEYMASQNIITMEFRAFMVKVDTHLAQQTLLNTMSVKTLEGLTRKQEDNEKKVNTNELNLMLIKQEIEFNKEASN